MKPWAESDVPGRSVWGWVLHLSLFHIARDKTGRQLYQLEDIASILDGGDSRSPTRISVVREG